MKIRVLLIFVLVYMPILNARYIENLEEGWKFWNAEEKCAKEVGFDDSKWEDVQVPHDWAIGKAFDMNIDSQVVQVWADGDKKPMLRTGRTGALPFVGVGWYRKVLSLPMEHANNKVFVEFDGAMSGAKVYLNGKYMGQWPYGYASFSIDLSSDFKYGQDNVLAVRLENKPEASRWYSGAGLYRHVRLVVVEPIHIGYSGVSITTPEVSEDRAKVKVDLEVVNPKNDDVEYVVKIYDNDENIVNDVEQRGGLYTIKKPKLWSIESPYLYSMLIELKKAGKIVDTYKTKFGIRSISYHAQEGFKLNGKRVQFKGVCMHHDLGPIGAAVNEVALIRQLKLLKEMGVNAIRTSHNPPAPLLLDLCDKMGIVVQCEAFDEWKIAKCVNGYNKLFDEWAKKDLVAMIKRDRNHPCVVMWSTGNEILEQINKEGWKTAKYLADIVKQTDPTRPSTSGFNMHEGAIKNGLADVIDLVGLNYKSYDYANLHKNKPNYIIYGSETVSTVSSRGEYKFPIKEDGRMVQHQDYHASSYDYECPKWGQSPDGEFAALEDNPFNLGEFVWTGFDYLGEPTPYNQGTPAKSSYFGIIDLAGFKKDRFYLYQSHWNKSAKVLHILPHWTWPDRIGQNVPVYCYTTYPKVELFVNGKSMGVRSKDKNGSALERYRLMWNDVVYQAGKLEAVAYNDEGKVVEKKTIKTAGEAKKIKLKADKVQMKANGKDLVFVEINVEDKDGNECPRSEMLMFCKVSGKAKLKALCNGDPTDQTSFASNYMRLFNGKLLAVIESSKESGEATLTVYASMIEPATIKITAK